MKRCLLPFFLSLLFLLPLNSAFADPINVHFISIYEYRLTQNFVNTLDVRSTGSREKSKLEVPGAVWIDPFSGPALRNFIATADKDAYYTIFCSCIDDNFSIRTAQILTKNGFKHVMVLKGGWKSIIDTGIKVVPIKQEG